MITKSNSSSSTASDERFLISELAVRANASIRTIRYYTEEGLLPPPDVQGKFALYSQAHVDRLLLIGQMKDRFLPLREIRALLSTLSDAEVRAQLALPAEAQAAPADELAKAAREPVSSPPPAVGKTSGSAALEYINRLLAEKPGEAASRPLSPHSPMPTTPPSGGFAPTPSPPGRGSLAPGPSKPAVPDGLIESSSQGEIWRRIELVPGLELHVHERFDPSAESRIQQIVFLSRKLFRSSHTK